MSGGVLVDWEIQSLIEHGEFVIEPHDDFRLPWLQPCSVDIRLGENFTYFAPHPDYVQNPKVFGHGNYTRNAPTVWIAPGEFLLATTLETFVFPRNVRSVIYGKSSWGRLGLKVKNAGFIEPGFRGELTLELKNEGPLYLELVWGTPIAQLELAWLNVQPRRVYGDFGLSSKYMNQSGATPAKIAPRTRYIPEWGEHLLTPK